MARATCHSARHPSRPLLTLLPPNPNNPPRPQRPACGLGAWFGAFNTDTQERSCVNRPKAAEAFFAIGNGTTLAAGAFAEEDLKLAQALRAKSTLVFPTMASCCKPGTGAHEEGCSKPK